MTATKSISNPEGGGKGFILAVIGIVIAGVALVAVLATQRDSSIENQTAEVSLDGDDLPRYENPGVAPPDDASIGMSAPEISGETFDGETLSITNDGRPKAIFFLAHWCSHCQAEVPKVQAMIDAGQIPDGIDLYGVSTAVDASRGNFPPESWLEREGWTPPTIKDSSLGAGLNSFGGASFPYVVYLDADNKVVTRSSGEIDNATILALMDLAILGSSPTEDGGEE